MLMRFKVTCVFNRLFAQIESRSAPHRKSVSILMCTFHIVLQMLAWKFISCLGQLCTSFSSQIVTDNSEIVREYDPGLSPGVNYDIFDMRYLRCPVDATGVVILLKDAHNIEAVVRHLKKLEDAQKGTVDSCLDELRHLVKSPMFTKDRALDRLLNLKMVAKEANHPKSEFNEAVLRAMREVRRNR